jgi:uncharacterized protein with FMN-binding domain
MMACRNIPQEQDLNGDIGGFHSMQLFLNIILARVATILSVLLAAILLLRLGRQAKPDSWAGRVIAPFFRAISPLDRHLRQIHIPLGMALFVTGLIHGLLSSEPVLSISLGTLSLGLSFMLAMNYVFRKKMRPGKWMSTHRVLTLFFVLALGWHIVTVGGFMPDVVETAFFNGTANQGTAIEIFQPANTVIVASTDSAPLESEPAAAALATKYKDGVYTASARGYGPNLTVQATIVNDLITDIRIVSHNERNARYYAYPMQVIPQAIIASQSTDVDTVSGATRTSDGIRNAVAAALAQALN